MTHRRRIFFAGVLLILAATFDVPAQDSQKVYRLGLLSAGARTPDGALPAALREGLRALGYVEGKNIVFEMRFAEAQMERLPGMAAELVRLKADAIVTQGGLAVIAAKEATSSIPIVMAPVAGDAVATGLIASLARPGGNVTGMTDESIQLSAKRMQLLKEALPKAATIAIIWNANDQGMTLRYREIEKAAQVLKVKVRAISVRKPEDFASAFAALEKPRPDALFLVADALTNAFRERVVEFAAARRLPAIYEGNSFTRAGGLMSYGPSQDDGFRTAAGYIDQIFKGAKVAELPAQQPMRHYLSINLKAAAAMGLTMPPALLLQADEVIK